MSFILFVALVVVIIKLVSLSSRVSNLEAQIGHKSVERVAPVVAYNPVSAPAQPAYVMPPPSGPDPLDKFFKWFSENWLLKVGVLMILVGFGWFISYAFVHNWIGPHARVALGLIVGSIIAVWGTLRMQSNSVQGTMLLVLGSALVVITSYASQVVYGFFTPAVALSIPFIVAVYLGFVAVMFDMRRLAIYSVLIGFIAPILTDSRVDIDLLYVYLLVITVGSVWVAAMKNWRVVNAVSVLGILFYSMWNVFDRFEARDNLFILGIIFVLSVLYFAVSIIGLVRSKSGASPSDVFVAIINSILIMLTTMTIVREELQSMVLAVWMVVFAAGSFFVYVKTGKEKLFYVYSLVSVVFLAVATSIELDGPSLVLAFTFEAAAISIASYLVTKKISAGYAMAWLMAVPALMALPSFLSNKWNTYILHEDFSVILAVGLTFMFLGVFYYSSHKEDADKGIAHLYGHTALNVVGSVYLLSLVWLCFHAGNTLESTATFGSLLVYSIIGLAAYVYGLMSNVINFKHYGATILILVVARLVFVDVWHMDLAPRIVTFIVIGILFISTAFIKKSKPAALVLLLVIPLLGGNVVSAMTIAQAAQVGSFRNVGSVIIPEIKVPTVVEVPIHNNSRSLVGVFVPGSNKFIPSLIVGDSSTKMTPSNSDELSDDDYETSRTFDLPADGSQGSVSLSLRYPKSIRSNSIVFSFDQYVALPTSITVRAFDTNGNEKVILSRIRPNSNTIQFPETNSSNWTIQMEYSQPLRINELTIINLDTVKSYSAVRFLAQPGVGYRIYSDPESFVALNTGEMPNLRDDKGVVKASIGKIVQNSDYKPADTDKDNIPDMQDNCVRIANTDQSDVDQNGRGDACDDFDRDGVVNSTDNCVNEPNQNQSDIDLDKVGDKCDPDESRITEKYPWIVWGGLGLVVILFGLMFAYIIRQNKPKPENNDIISNN